jgi:hypothetical protein
MGFAEYAPAYPEDADGCLREEYPRWLPML